MATNNGPKCVQYYFKDYLDEGNEDCLYLNIYTPQVKKKSIKYKLISEYIQEY